MKGGSIEPHPTENALIINYTLEATVFNEPGDAMLEKSKVIFTFPITSDSYVYFQSGMNEYLLTAKSCALNLQWSTTHTKTTFHWSSLIVCVRE